MNVLKNLNTILKKSCKDIILKELKELYDNSNYALQYNVFKKLAYKQNIYNRLSKTDIDKIWNKLIKHFAVYSKQRVDLKTFDRIMRSRLTNPAFTKVRDQLISDKKNGKLEVVKKIRKKPIDKIALQEKAIMENKQFVDSAELHDFFYFNREEIDDSRLLTDKNEELKNTKHIQFICSKKQLDTLKDNTPNIHYKIIKAFKIPKRERIIDGSYYSIVRAKNFHEKIEAKNLSKAQYNRKMNELKRTYTKNFKKSYIVVIDYNRDFKIPFWSKVSKDTRNLYTEKQKTNTKVNLSIGIGEYLNNQVDYPKIVDYDGDKTVLFLNKPNLFNLKTLKPTSKKSFSSLIRDTYAKEHKYEKFLEAKVNNKQEELLKRSIEYQRKKRSRYKLNRSKKQINLFNEFVKSYGINNELIDVLNGLNRNFRKNLRSKSVKTKGSYRTTKFLHDNIIFKLCRADQRRYYRDVKRLTKELKRLQYKKTLVKKEATIKKYEAKIKNMSKELNLLKAQKYDRQLVIQTTEANYRSILFTKFKAFFYNYLLKQDLSCLNKEIRSFLVKTYKEKGNLGFRTIEKHRTIEFIPFIPKLKTYIDYTETKVYRYFKNIFNKCIYNIVKAQPIHSIRK